MNFSDILELVFPSTCLGCGVYTDATRVLCDPCYKEIPIAATLRCGLCRSRLPYGKRICHPRFPYILGTVASYEHPTVRNLVHALKFDCIDRAAIPLGNLLIGYAEALSLTLPRAFVVPMPLSIKRERERGFNQASLIAKRFADHFSLTFAPELLLRTAHKKPQSEQKSFDARRKNVVGVFKAAPSTDLEGKTIILIDDVVTSGATFLEAANALKAAGARRIFAFAVASAN